LSADRCFYFLKIKYAKKSNAYALWGK